MAFTPTGYFVLIRMEKVEQVTESGIILHTGDQTKREQRGHFRGVVEAFGPSAYSGLDAIPDGPDTSAEGRAAQWGVAIGDVVEFKRYDGLEIEIPGSDDFYRVVKDFDIIGVKK